MTPIAYNTLRSGYRHRVHGKWVGYRDGSAWRMIDAAFRNDGASFVSDYMPARFSVPALSTQTATVEVNNSYDVFGKSSITDPAFVLDITPEGVTVVDGQIDESNPTQVVYHGAYRVGGVPVGDLIYGVWHGRAPRLEKVVRVNSLTGITSEFVEYSWLIQHTDARAYVGGNRWDGSTSDVAAPVTVRKGDSLTRGAGLKAPVAWYYDADGKLVVTPIATRWEYVDANTMRLTKIVPRTLIATALAARPDGWIKLDATATIYPDPDAETNSVDGYTQRTIPFGTYHLYGGAVTCADLIAGAGTASNDSYFLAYLQHYFNGASSYIFSRSIYGFDLSSLSGTVSAATLNLTFWGGQTGSVRLTGASPASNTALVASDHQGIYTNYDASLSDDTAVGSGARSIALTQAGLDYLTGKLGSVGFLAMRDTNDKVGGANIGNGLQIYTYSADQSGTASDPYLEVTYGAAAASGVCRSSCSNALSLCLR